MVTGIARRVDELGRIVLPIEIRRTLGIEERDLLMIELDGNRITLEKWQASCVFCNSLVRVTTYKGKQVCRECMEELTSNK